MSQQQSCCGTMLKAHLLMLVLSVSLGCISAQTSGSVGSEPAHIGQQRALLQARTAPGPASSGLTRAMCSLPNGRSVSALKGSSEQSLFDYISSSYPYTSVVSSCVSKFSTGYFGGLWWGRKMLASPPTQVRPQAPATAAITCAGTLYAYPACCPSRITLGGDTVNSLVNEKSLNELFYAINPTITPKNDPDSPLAAGLNVTVPCSRIVSLGIPS